MSKEKIQKDIKDIKVKKADNKKKDNKNNKKDKNKIKTFFTGVKSEAKKTTWHNFPDTMKDSGTVFVTTAVIGAGVWICDYVFSLVIGLLG